MLLFFKIIPLRVRIGIKVGNIFRQEQFPPESNEFLDHKICSIRSKRRAVERGYFGLHSHRSKGSPDRLSRWLQHGNEQNDEERPGIGLQLPGRWFPLPMHLDTVRVRTFPLVQRLQIFIVFYDDRRLQILCISLL